MNWLRRIAAYYRLQLQVMREWRPSGRAALRRIIVVFIVSTISLALTALLLPGISMDRPAVAFVAVIVLAAVTLLIRPIALAAFAAVSVIAVIIATLVFQGLAFLIVEWFLPEFHVNGFVSAFLGAIVFSLFNTIFLAIFGVDEDESYWASLMQQLVTRDANVIRTDQPGLVMIQIDGLAHPILEHQIRAGRVPFISSWLRSGEMQLDRWEALLPSQTSASQAGILHGNNSFIPAFRWWEKDRGVLMVSNHPEDAAEIVRRASDGQGLLSNNGASVGNLVSGDATRAYITMATIKEREQGIDKSRAYYSFFLSPDNYLRAVVRSVGEIVKEYIQASRQVRNGIIPRMHRGMPYPVARAATNVILRSLGTSLVMEEMYRGTPAIYIDYTDYDEIAHHSGPERGETLDALDGVDKTIRSLVRASKHAPRPYRFVLLSDHGQSLGSTFLQRYGVTLEAVVSKLMGGADAIASATGSVEEWGSVNAFLSESSRAKGMTGAVVRTAFKSRSDDGSVDITPRLQATMDASARPETPASEPQGVAKAGTGDAGAAGTAKPELPELVVCASGNLGLVTFPRIPGRATLEQMETSWPGMVDALANHPGIGFVMVRSETRGPIAVGAKGLRYLGDDTVVGQDPVAPYGGHSADGLRRVDGMEHCPDIVVISLLDPNTDEVAAFEELIGSHGGLGGPQTHPFILHPSDWPITRPIVGAEAVYDQIRDWMALVGIMPPRTPRPGEVSGNGSAPAAPAAPVTAAAATTTTATAAVTAAAPLAADGAPSA